MLNSEDTKNRIQLFFFPFAGASFYSFNPLIKLLQDTLLTATPLELPGRGKRTKEPLLLDIHTMADDLFARIKDQIKDHSELSYAFYGHSMGSLLAFEVIQRLIKTGMALPDHLFVSGRGGPEVSFPYNNIGLLSKDAFFELLRTFGGTPDHFLNDTDLMAFFEPVLRADFTASAKYSCTITQRLDLPVSVFNGTEDRIHREEAMKWQAVTTKPVAFRDYSGGHFFLFDHAQDISDVIRKTLLKD
jgi:surfactin synthase thioesterase subunit